MKCQTKIKKTLDSPAEDEQITKQASTKTASKTKDTKTKDPKKVAAGNKLAKHNRKISAK